MKNKVLWLVLGLLLIAGGVILYGFQLIEKTTTIDFSRLSEFKTYTIENYNEFDYILANDELEVLKEKVFKYLDGIK